MAKGKQKTDANTSAQESVGKKKAQRGVRSKNNDKTIDESENGDVQNESRKKTLRKRQEGHDCCSYKDGRRKSHDVEIDQKTYDAEKQSKGRDRKRASKKTSHVPKDFCTSVSEQTVAEDESGIEETLTDIKMDKGDSKPNIKVKKNHTTNSRKSNVKNAASKQRQKDLVDTKERIEGKLDSKTELDETDGDVETSEYFDSDSSRNYKENHQKRKRKYSGEKKTMSSKVKHLKTLKPDLEFNKSSKVPLIQTKEDDSSDSDFEDVPDVNVQSPSTSHALNIKKEATTTGKKETVSKVETSGKERIEIKEKAKPEKSGLKGIKSGGKRKTDLKRKNDEGPMESEKKVPEKKRKQEVHSSKIEIKTKVTKRKSDCKVAEKTKVNKNKTDNSKHVKTEHRKPKQKDEITHKLSLKKSIENSDITALLLHMEGPGALVKPSTSFAKDDDEMMSDEDDDDDDNDDDDNEDDDDEEGDWEDVEDHHGYHSPVKSQLPDKPVEITLDAPVLYKKRKKKEFDIKAYFQRQINKYKRELNISMHKVRIGIKANFQRQINKCKRELNISIHKVHLLCLLSRGFYLNNLCMDETLEAQALSITMVTRELKIASVKSCDVNGLSYMIKWMKEAFPLKTCGEDLSDDLRGRLECGFQQRSVTNRLEFVLTCGAELLILDRRRDKICVILLRQLGFLTRLVMSLQPIPIRTVPKKESNSGKKRSGNPAKIQKKIKEGVNAGHKKDQPGAKTVQQGKPQQKLANEKTIKTATVKRNAKTKSDTDVKHTENKNMEVKANSAAKALSFEKSDKNNRTGSKGNEKERTKNIKGTSNSKEDIGNNRLQTKNKSRRSCASKIKPNTYVDNDGAADDVVDSEEDYVPGKAEKAAAADDYDSDIENGNGDDALSEEDKKMTKVKNKRTKKEKIESSDSEFAEESFQVRTQSLKKVPSTQKNKKALSTDSGEIVGTSSGADEWVEVYLQKEQKWICIDCVTGKLAKPYSVEHNATPPVHYVVAFSEDGTIKDLTARYASQWLTTTRKFRGDEDWWGETVDLYKPVDRLRDEEENLDIQSHLLQRPLPTSIAAFKSHPLYALKRHLLKFEALYPETAVPLGYVRGEPVYARECVHVGKAIEILQQLRKVCTQQLHSCENWLKEGRAVRVGEEPYKHVKSRPKWNKPKENPDALDLEVFGRWQTEVYIPPPAVDGKVPRNAHGNVELFLPSMLPAGTVHLQIEGLNKVAKKLDIDCAAAMVGWDHHCGFSHPRMDGWIVCEEFKDILLAAWDEEQEIIREKEQEKREKRVYTNWKLLIKGLLIKERLKKRFDFEEEDQAKGKEKQPIGDESQEKAEDYKHAWPQNRQDKQQKHFDVEKL